MCPNNHHQPSLVDHSSRLNENTTSIAWNTPRLHSTFTLVEPSLDSARSRMARFRRRKPRPCRLPRTKFFRHTLALGILLVAAGQFLRYLRLVAGPPRFWFEGLYEPIVFRSTEPLHIFYNAYAPSDAEGQARAVRIVDEQLAQVASSYGGRRFMVHLHYKTIGTDRVLDLKPHCRRYGWICHTLGHSAEGFEDLTLRPLYDHCVRSRKDRVVYLHSKGSFHSDSYGRNDIWRRHLTLATTSRGCLSHVGCDICGLNFCPRWGAFIMAGNMFAAQCGYIRRLLPLDDYTSRLGVVREELDSLAGSGNLALHLYNKTSPWKEQVNRYMWEMWPASHPAIRPCDLSPTPSLGHWIEKRRSIWKFSWAMAPRHLLTNERWHVPYPDPRTQETLSNESWRLRDYFLLAGHLVRWMALYKEYPPRDSWVWKWFPDGDMWLQAVLADGNNAVRSVTDRYRTDIL